MTVGKFCLEGLDVAAVVSKVMNIYLKTEECVWVVFAAQDFVL